MRKIIVAALIFGAVFCRQTQAMFRAWGDDESAEVNEQMNRVIDERNLEEEEYATAPSTRSSSPVLDNKIHPVDQCINGLITTLKTARPVLDGMYEADALNVQAITHFYDVSTSTWRYRGLYIGENLAVTAHNPKSFLAPAAHLAVSLIKNVPVIGSHLARLESTNNNNNNNSESSSHPSASSNVTPVSNAAYTLRKLNLNKVVIDIMKEYESVGDEILKRAHKVMSENGDDIISFMENNRDTISNVVRTAVQYGNDNREEIHQTIKIVSDAYKEYGNTVKDYLSEHSEEIRQQTENVKTFFPVFMAGIRAASKEYARVKHDQILFKTFPDTLARRNAEGREEGMTDWFK